MMLIIWMAIVTRNSRLAVMAAFRSFFLFIVRFVKPYWDDASTDAIRRLKAPTTTNKVRSEKVKGGSCVIYPSSIWYSILVVFVSWLRVSFWMITDLPAALANEHAMALLKRQPTCRWVFGCESVCLQISSSVLPVISRVRVFPRIWISALSASSMPSTSSFGSLFWIWLRSVFVKEKPSSSSKRRERADPGGVTKAPVFWFVSCFSFVSSGVGSGVLGVLGMNTRLESMFLRLFGGR